MFYCSHKLFWFPLEITGNIAEILTKTLQYKDLTGSRQDIANDPWESFEVLAKITSLRSRSWQDFKDQPRHLRILRKILQNPTIFRGDRHKDPHEIPLHAFKDCFKGKFMKSKIFNHSKRHKNATYLVIVCSFSFSCSVFCSSCLFALGQWACRIMNLNEQLTWKYHSRYMYWFALQVLQ